MRFNKVIMNTEYRTIWRDIIEYCKTPAGMCVLTFVVAIWLFIIYVIFAGLLFDTKSLMLNIVNVVLLKNRGISDPIRYLLIFVNFISLIVISIWFLAGPVRDYLKCMGIKTKRLEVDPTFKIINSDDSWE